jgi:KDO2-lipid IV(A) lauroyltransferase
VTRLRHLLEYGLIRAARGLDRLLGARRSAALAAALGRLVYRRLRVRADVVEAQLRAAFPDRDDAWVRATATAAYAHLAREAMMMIRLSRLGPDAVIDATEMDGLDALRDALAEGNGALVVSGHLGNWEIGGSGIAARGVPLDAVARRQNNPYVDRMVNRARNRLGMRIIPMGGATKKVLRSLAKGRVVGLVADQDARRRGTFVPFMGRPASTHRGPALLALRSGAPVFAAAALRRPDGRYHVRMRRVPIPAPTEAEAGSAADPGPTAAAGEADASLREWKLTAALAAALETAVREHPEQYLWHHRRWKTVPSEAEWTVLERRAGGALARQEASSSPDEAPAPGNGPGADSV